MCSGTTLKVCVVVGGGWWVLLGGVETKFSVRLWPKPFGLRLGPSQTKFLTNIRDLTSHNTNLSIVHIAQENIWCCHTHAIFTNIYLIEPKTNFKNLEDDLHGRRPHWKMIL
jgi:hypothetical protein